MTNNPHTSPVPVEMIEKTIDGLSAKDAVRRVVGDAMVAFARAVRDDKSLEQLTAIIDEAGQAVLSATGVPELVQENTRLKAALKKIQRRATKGCQNHPPFSPVYRQAHAIGVIAQQALVAVDDPASFGL